MAIVDFIRHILNSICYILIFIQNKLDQVGPDTVTISILVMTYVIPFSFCSAYSVMSEEPEIYEPDIINIMSFPPSRQVPPNIDFIIYAKIMDRYSEINKANLLYIDNKVNISSSIKMELIDGTFSNGTFRGVIPMYSTQYTGTNVSYTLTFSDGLNYSSKYSNSFVVEDDTSAPKVNNLEHEVIQGFNTTLNVNASDSESGIRNVTLYYSTPSLNSSVKMKLVDGDKWDGVYEGVIPSLDLIPGNDSLSSFLKVYDLSNQSYTSDSYIFYEKPWWIEILNKFFTEIKILDVDPGNHTSRISINVEAPAVIKSELSEEQFSFIDSPIGAVYSGDNKYEFSYTLSNFSDVENYPLPNDSNVTSLGMSKLEDRKVINQAVFSDLGSIFLGEPVIGHVQLLGDPYLYPFDHYYTRLEVDYPIRNPILPPDDQNVFIEGPVNSSWIASWIAIPGMDGLGLDKTVYTIFVDFKRNYTILVLVIPLLAIFYLLGASFIFENTLDRLGNRLALTLGIIALIFTLNNIIDRIRPITGGPTIADSILSITIIAAIVFAISSIVSSSSIIQKRFPRGYRFIDAIMLIIVSGIAIALLSNFDTEITRWLLPVIIFGLGYGFLVRKISLSKVKSTMLVKGNPDRYDFY